MCQLQRGRRSQSFAASASYLSRLANSRFTISPRAFGVAELELLPTLSKLTTVLEADEQECHEADLVEPRAALSVAGPTGARRDRDDDVEAVPVSLPGPHRCLPGCWWC
jgi:hypothetical protein